MFGSINPFQKIADKANGSLAKRFVESTYWQKVVDFYQLLAGSSSFSYCEPPAGVTFPPVYFELIAGYEMRHPNLGLLDYGPFIIFRLILRGSSYLIEGNLHLGSNIFAKILENVLFGTGVVVFLLFSGLHFAVATLFTLISMPLIALAHGISILVEKSIMEKNTAAQNTDPSQPEELTSTVSKNIKYKHINSIEAMREFFRHVDENLSVVTADVEEPDAPNKLVLLEKVIPLPQFVGFPNQYNYEYYFLRFNYSSAGYAALNALNDGLHLFQTPGLVGALVKLTERDKKIGHMINTFFVLAQMSRNPGQQFMEDAMIVGYSENDDAQQNQGQIIKHDEQLNLFAIFARQPSRATFLVPAEMAKEIAVRTMDHKDGLSLETRHAILNEAEQRLNIGYKSS